MEDEADDVQSEESLFGENGPLRCSPARATRVLLSDLPLVALHKEVIVTRFAKAALVLACIVAIGAAWMWAGRVWR